MKVKPLNNRILIEEIQAENAVVNGIVIPDFVKDRKTIEKFLECRVLDVSSLDFQFLIGKKCVVETGMIEEVVINKKKYIFCPVNYIVCVIMDENVS